MENRKFIKMRRVILFPVLIFLGVIMASILIGSQWMLFVGKAIKGYVVDAETNKPMEGTIVVAMWRLSQIGSQGFGGYAKVIVVKTDKEGRFATPLWMAFNPLTATSVMHDHAPEIVIYKPGYKLYFSHRVAREGFPNYHDYEMKPEEKEMIKEKYTINPTRLVRIYTDEEIWENHKEFRSQANFPDKSYSKKQLEEIFTALQRGMSQLPASNQLSKERLSKDIQEDREFYIRGEK